MLRIILIALLAAVGYFAAGAAVLIILRVVGVIRRHEIGEEEQMIAVAVWPLYLAVIVPVYGVIALSKKISGDGRHIKK